MNNVYTFYLGENKGIEEYSSAFAQGDEKALSFFYHEFHPALSLFAYKFIKDRLLAEEIASNAFVKIWKFHYKLNSYSVIRSYLYSTVRNECHDVLRLKNRKLVVLKETLPLVIESNTPFDNLVRSEVARLIRSALEELSPGNRTVLTMHYLEGKSTREIAAELNISHHTIKSQKSRGLEKLRKILLRPVSLLYGLIIFLY